MNDEPTALVAATATDVHLAVSENGASGDRDFGSRIERRVQGEKSAAAKSLRGVSAQHRLGDRDARAGVDIEAAVKTVGRSEREKWLLFDDYHGRNVTQSFKEVEWE